MKFLLFIAFTVVTGASIAQTTGNTTTLNPSYQQTVSYLEDKLNKLATYLQSGGPSIYDNSLAEYFSNFKISKDTDGNIFLKLKRTDKFSGTNNVATNVHYITIPICNFTDIQAKEDVRWGNAIVITTSGETIADFIAITNHADELKKTYYWNYFSFNLRMESSNTLEKIRKAFFNLKSYCPQPKKDIFDN